MKNYHDFLARNRHENVLDSALLELTYRCNLDCFFCYNDLSMHGRRMRFADYTKLLKDLASMNVMTVSLSGGEPLSYHRFWDLGTLARDLGFVINVKTNGHSVGPRIARRLREEVDPYLVETSLHGATAATHDRQTRVPGSFERLLRNIRAMLDEGMRVRVNSALTSWNEKEVQGMWDLADGFGVTLRFDTDVTPRDDGDPEPLQIQASDEGVANMLRIGMQRSQTRVVSNPRQAVPVKHPGNSGDKQQKHKNCGAGSTHATIDPFGNVYPCVAFRRKIGNLHDSSMSQIWNGSAELGVIREITYQAQEVKEKNALKSFCPGLAELTTGDPLAVYPGIARTTRIHSEISRKRPANG